MDGYFKCMLETWTHLSISVCICADLPYPPHKFFKQLIGVLTCCWGFHVIANGQLVLFI